MSFRWRCTNDGVIKTQIQLPDALYRDIKRLAASREWSLAETMRRAAEQFLARHPVLTPPPSPWRPPVSDTVGWRGLSHEAIRETALDDLEARTVETLRKTGQQGKRRR